MTGCLTLRVRGYHIDAYGHVNNARYLEFLEEARWCYFEENGWLEDFLASGLGFVVVNINIDYRRGARMNDELSIATRLVELGARKGVVHQRITLAADDAVVADARITFVLLNLNTGKSAPIDGALAQRLSRVLQAA